MTAIDSEFKGYPKPKLNLSEKMNELLSLNRFGKGQDNDEIYDLLKEFTKRREKDLIKVLEGNMSMEKALSNLREEAGEKLI